MAQVDFAWELGGGTGHVATLHRLALALKLRGHAVRFLQRDTSAGADLEGAGAIPREGAPVWVGPAKLENPLNLGEILCNFGYGSPASLRPLVDAWRERLKETQLVVANVAPAAHLAAHTLGIPSLEISQGFHVPPPVLPSPPLRDWEPVSRARLEDADRTALHAINAVLAAYARPGLRTLGDLFSGRALLLTYPELDIYPQRGPAEYYGIPDSGEGHALPEWPAGKGPRIFAYVYNYYPGLALLLEALERIEARALVMCRGIDRALAKRAGGSIAISEEPMALSRLLSGCDLVVCHGSHQTTAQALLAGKPVLLLPTQLEQFLITRRVVRQGMGLGIEPGAKAPDFSAALRALAEDPAYGQCARRFAERYAAHDRAAAMASMVQRCEAALAGGVFRSSPG